MDKPKNWLSIVGIGDDGLDGLGVNAKRVIETADLVIGGKRHLSFLSSGDQKHLQWPTPWNTMLQDLNAAKQAGEKVVVLASGDPFWFGAGSLVAKHFDQNEWSSVPHPSSFQFAAHRLGWPLQACKTISLHGRPTTDALTCFQFGGKILALAESKTAAELRDLLDQKGFEQVEIQVLAHLAGADENAYKFEGGLTEELVVLAFDLGSSRLHPPLSGLPDSTFQHDGQLTKQEVRAITLAKLAPADGETLWDLGAGCGSIGIEWCRLNSTAKAVAFERDETRLNMIHANALELAAFNFDVCVHDVANPIDKPAPDAIFIGGGLSQTLLDDCWSRLPTGGRLVANAVTLESETLLNEFPTKLGLVASDCLCRIAVERPIKVGNKFGWKPFMTVTQLALVK